MSTTLPLLYSMFGLAGTGGKGGPLWVCVVTSEKMSFYKGTQGFTHCLFKAVSLAMLNKQMQSHFATYDALSLVITKPSSFGLAPQVLIYVQP